MRCYNYALTGLPSFQADCSEKQLPSGKSNIRLIGAKYPILIYVQHKKQFIIYAFHEVHKLPFQPATGIYFMSNMATGLPKRLPRSQMSDGTEFHEIKIDSKFINGPSIVEGCFQTYNKFQVISLSMKREFGT